MYAMVTLRKKKDVPEKFSSFITGKPYLAVFFYTGVFIFLHAGKCVRTNDRGFKRWFRVPRDLKDIAGERCLKILARRKTKKRRGK